MREELIDEFDAEGDDGEAYIVVTYQRFTTFSGLGGTREIPGTFRHALLDGRHVNELDDGSFQILDSGVRLRKI